MPLDAAEFDKSCEYRFQLTPTNTADDPYMGNDPYQYVNAVDNDRLTWFILPGSHYHINFDSKTIYRVNGVPNPDTISKLEKFCGGGGGSGGGMSAPSVISCKKKNSTYATSTLTGQPLVKFTASDCGGTLPDASYNGALGSLNVCNGAIDHTLYSGGSVNGP